DRARLGDPQTTRCGSIRGRGAVATRIRGICVSRKGDGVVITCLCLIYAGFVVLLFKLKVAKPRPYPIAWFAAGGVVLIGAIVLFWRLDAPQSGRVVTTQYVVQLVPYVKGQVTKVVAQANQRMKKGDLLLEVDPAPYQYVVSQLEAQLEGAAENVKLKQA